MGLLVRHITPGLGVVPRNPEKDACSGLVGVAIGTAQAQADLGHSTEIHGWNPESGGQEWLIGDVTARATSGWNAVRFRSYDFRVTAPLIAMTLRYDIPDATHVYTDPHLLLGRGKQLKFLHFQTPIPERPNWSYTRLVNMADGVICCGSFIRNQFLSRVDFPEERVFEVNNGIDLTRFQNVDRNRYRSEWGISNDSVVVLFAGALVPEKGLLVLLKALADIPEPQHLEIVVAGTSSLWLTPDRAGAREETPYANEVRRYASNLRIRWLGSVPSAAMPDLHAAADICVVPSIWDEPFGLVACEAMAAGTPVVASARGGLSQVVADGETGLLVPSGNPDALRAALLQLIDSSDARTRMRSNALQRAKQFSWSRAASQLDSLYEELGVDRLAQVQGTGLHSTGTRRAR